MFSCSKRPLWRYKPSSLSFSWMANGMQALGLSKARSHFKNQTRKGNGLTCNRWEALTAPTVCSSHSCTDVGAAKQSAHKVRFQLISRTQWWSPEAQELPGKQATCPCCAELGEAGSTAWLKSNYAGAVQISGHAAAEGAQWLQLNIQCSCNEIMSVLTSSSLSSIPTQSILQYNNSAVNLQASYSKLMGILTRRENINQSNYKAYRGRFGALHCFSVPSNYWIFCSKTT